MVSTSSSRRPTEQPSAYDLHDQVVWKQFLGGGWQRGAAIPSPVLVDDLMIVVGYEPSNTFKKKRHRKDCKRLALSKKTGEVVWQAPMTAQYQTNPVVFNLPVGGDAGKREAFLLDQRGQDLRARDGKVVATGIGSSAVARPWPVQGDIAVVVNGSRGRRRQEEISRPSNPGWVECAASQGRIGRPGDGRTALEHQDCRVNVV